MRPPWDHGAQASSDLEALQTDVMRFVAILGLCLAAIFSLVNGAHYEQAETAAEPAEQRIPEFAEPVPLPPPPTAAAEPQPAIAEQPVEAPPTRSPPETGFTLEFESGEALSALLAAGRIELFALAEGHFNRYRPGAGFQQTAAPSSWYSMDPATVPPRIRLQAQGLLSASAEWGVTLPAETAAEIQRLMSGGEGGNLLIGADAAVTVAGGSERAP